MNQDDFTRKNPDSASCKSKHQSVARTRIHQLWMFWGIPVNVRYCLPKIGCKGNRCHEDFANQIRSHPAMVSRRATLELHGQFSVRSSVLSTTGNTYARTYKYDDSDFPTWVQVGIKLPFKQFMVQPEYLWVIQILTHIPRVMTWSFAPCLGSGNSTAGRFGNSNPKPQAPAGGGSDDRRRWL